jgi:hypothetical protein
LQYLGGGAWVLLKHCAIYTRNLSTCQVLLEQIHSRYPGSGSVVVLGRGPCEPGIIPRRGLSPLEDGISLEPHSFQGTVKFTLCVSSQPGWLCYRERS